MKFSKEEKARLIEDWRRSGKNISTYARENGLVRWTFTKWLKAERGAKPCFVEIQGGAAQPPRHAQEILIEKGEIKIHIPLCVLAEGSGAVMEGLRRVL